MIDAEATPSLGQIPSLDSDVLRILARADYRREVDATFKKAIEGTDIQFEDCLDRVLLRMHFQSLDYESKLRLRRETKHRLYEGATLEDRAKDVASGMRPFFQNDTGVDADFFNQQTKSEEIIPAEGLSESRYIVLTPQGFVMVIPRQIYASFMKRFSPQEAPLTMLPADFFKTDDKAVSPHEGKGYLIMDSKMVYQNIQLGLGLTFPWKKDVVLPYAIPPAYRSGSLTGTERTQWKGLLLEEQRLLQLLASYCMAGYVDEIPFALRRTMNIDERQPLTQDTFSAYFSSLYQPKKLNGSAEHACSYVSALSGAFSTLLERITSTSVHPRVKGLVLYDAIHAETAAATFETIAYGVQAKLYTDRAFKDLRKDLRNETVLF